MRSELSEFSYGFAITAELRDLFWPWVVEAPIFPTLRAEAQLGWDVRFPVNGRSFFLQFKVADALTRATAAEWSDYGAPYYRFPLHRLSRSDQHNRLRTLAATEPFVFYVAPRFHTLFEFNQSYRKTNVAPDSVWIPLSSLPAVTDDLQHHLTYRTGTDVRFASPESEPVGKAVSGEALRGHIVRQLEAEKHILTTENFLELRSSLLRIVSQARVRYVPEMAMPTDMQSGFQLFKDITYLTRTYFGAEFLLIHRQQG